MELPDTEPVYVIDPPPSVPNRIELPLTVPFTRYLWGGDEILMVPLSSFPDCVQVSMKVPLSAPLYRPDHVPESPPATATADVRTVVVAAAALAAAVAAESAVTLSPDRRAMSPREVERRARCVRRRTPARRAEELVLVKMRMMCHCPFRYLARPAFTLLLSARVFGWGEGWLKVHGPSVRRRDVIDIARHAAGVRRPGRGAIAGGGRSGSRPPSGRLPPIPTG